MLLAAASAAHCQYNTMVDGYGGESGVLHRMDCNKGGLPMTGFDVGLMLLGAAVLIGVGLLLRWSAKRQQQVV